MERNKTVEGERGGLHAKVKLILIGGEEFTYISKSKHLRLEVASFDPYDEPRLRV